MGACLTDGHVLVASSDTLERVLTPPLPLAQFCAAALLLRVLSRRGYLWKRRDGHVAERDADGGSPEKTVGGSGGGGGGGGGARAVMSGGSTAAPSRWRSSRRSFAMHLLRLIGRHNYVVMRALAGFVGVIGVQVPAVRVLRAHADCLPSARTPLDGEWRAPSASRHLP